MADITTPVVSRIRSLFPDLEPYSPSPPHLPAPLSGCNRHHFTTVPRLRRGPMYSAYSELRESRLRRKKKEGSSPLGPMTKTPAMPEKKGAPAVARSVPDFLAALRKENRNPVGWASPVPPKASKLAVTLPRPPPATVVASSKGGAGAPGRVGRSASANGRDEKGCGGGFAVRKSYSCLKELKGLSGVASWAIEEEGRAPGSGKGAAKKLARRYY